MVCTRYLTLTDNMLPPSICSLQFLILCKTKRHRFCLNLHLDMLLLLYTRKSYINSEITTKNVAYNLVRVTGLEKLLKYFTSYSAPRNPPELGVLGFWTGMLIRHEIYRNEQNNEHVYEQKTFCLTQNLTEKCSQTAFEIDLSHRSKPRLSHSHPDGRSWFCCYLPIFSLAHLTNFLQTFIII